MRARNTQGTIAAGALLSLGLAGCGGEPPGAAQVEQQVFTVSCVFSSCHSGPAPRAGLDLTAATRAALVDVASTERPSKALVAPGDPDASFLLDKLLDRDLPQAPATDPAWTSMPPGMPLEAERIDLVRRWIEGGALP